MEQAMISGVVGDASEAKITITNLPDRPGIAGQLFRRLADRDVNVDMIVQNVSEGGATDISFTLPKDELAAGREVSEALAQRDRRRPGHHR